MDARGDDGIPYRVHLEVEATGLIPNPVAIAELESEPFLPMLTADVWGTYQQLAMRRAYNENGPIRFSFENIEAFMRVTEVRLGRWYLKTLFALDDAYFTARAEVKK